MGKEQALEVFVGDVAGLREAIHVLSDFHIDVSIVDKVVELVVFHDRVGNGQDGDVHVGIIGQWHGCAEVKVFEVTHHASCTWCGDDAIEKEFCGDDVSSFGADIPKIFDLVATHGPAYVVGVGFFRPVSAYYAEICGMFALWDSRDRDEKHGVGPRDNVVALGQSVDFSSVGCSPEVAIRTVAEFLVFGKFAGVQV